MIFQHFLFQANLQAPISDESSSSNDINVQLFSPEVIKKFTSNSSTTTSKASSIVILTEIRTDNQLSSQIQDDSRNSSI
ncbi:hypothetical protein GLOIN_2v1483732 [Rhizophagus clarus]|uniref:Uncharacterized protein n=1 Tax=Rhizophagus clarus TaxID=94130 RepID=A0A8H3MD18_9GLOM|nr:hypothetical protein GLOIN_2v1483732 [Rhizophagus clarus]